MNKNTLNYIDRQLKYAGTVLVLAACSLVMRSADAQTAKAVATQSFPSVVLVLMDDAKGQPISLGSGFFVPGGYVATNAHVVRGASRGLVRMVGKPDKGEITGIVAMDAARDLVILAVKGVSGPALPLGQSNQIMVGEEVFAIGNPQGLEGTISQGIVSGVRRIANTDILQVTAPISPGSSGGPVLNQKGQVVGVAVATFRGGQNLNFAIPVGYLSALLTQPKSNAPLNSLAATKEKNSPLSEMGPSILEGVTSSNLVCEPHGDFTQCSWSLLNKLRSPVRDVRQLMILWSKAGEPLDTWELHQEGVIRPGLAIRFYPKRSIPATLKKMTSKIEVRVLDFVVEN